MTAPRPFLWVLAALALTATRTEAQSPARVISTAQASVELISESGSVPEGGGDLWLGVRFRLQPGWHIYWQNPGDSGVPPTVTWTLPPGAAAEPFTWPAPSRLPVGPLVNYGYEGDVVLPVRIRVARTAAREAPFRVRADLRWLVCREVCVPGKGALVLSLPAKGAEGRQTNDWARRIALGRSREPKPAPAWLRTSVVSTREAFVLRVDTTRRVSVRTFYPLHESQIDDSAPQRVTTNGTRAEIRLRKSDQLMTDPPTLSGVVTFSDGESFVVTATIRRS